MQSDRATPLAQKETTMPEISRTNIDVRVASSVPRTVTAGRVLLGLNAAIWATLGMVTYLRLSALTSTAAAVVALLMVMNAAVMGWLAGRLGRGTTRVFSLAVAILAVNIILTITDEFGLADFAMLVLELATMLVLLAMRDWYRGDGVSTDGGTSGGG
jgi:hypothetical protein